MKYEPDSPFYRLLDTKYDPEREEEALSILQEHPEIAKFVWPGPDERGQPFIRNSTALHYAANDGKLKLIKALIKHGADVNSCHANWYATPMSWAANNAHLDAIKLLLMHGADIKERNVIHAAAFGGSSCGKNRSEDYLAVMKFLIENGADMNILDFHQRTPLATAIGSGNDVAIQFLKSRGAKEV